MEVTVIASANEARSDDFVNKTVIVIDVLRATSTMLTALHHGCEAIYPVETVLQAKLLLLEQPGWLTGGERSCRKIPGFDLGNSPYEYMDDHIAGKTMILTTANGTRAIQKACRASHLLIGSLLNGRACAAEAAALNKNIVILCSGTQDVFAFEDGICAGQIIEELQIWMQKPDKELQVNDLGLSQLHAYRQVQSTIGLTEALLKSSNGRRLDQLGFRADVIYCSRMNQIPLVPTMQNGRLSGSPVQQCMQPQ